MLRFHLLLLLSLAIGTACNYKIQKGSVVDTISVSEQLKQTVSYNQVKGVVFQTKCISCHGNSGGVNLESYQSAVRYLDAIKKTVFMSRSMPKAPFAGLDRRQSEVLLAWIEAGGPERPIGGGDTIPEPLPVPVEPTYPSIKAHILDMKCISCHRPGGQAASVPLVTKEVEFP